MAIVNLYYIIYVPYINKPRSKFHERWHHHLMLSKFSDDKNRLGLLLPFYDMIARILAASNKGQVSHVSCIINYIFQVGMI